MIKKHHIFEFEFQVPQVSDNVVVLASNKDEAVKALKRLRVVDDWEWGEVELLSIIQTETIETWQPTLN